MSEFNERTALNYKLRQDALTVESRRRMALQRKASRHRRAAHRAMVRAVAIDAVLVGAGLTAVITAVACAII
jgi:hypothetical protein